MSINNTPNWIYQRGIEDNIILFSKVSVYRNVENIRFFSHMEKYEIEKIDEIFSKELKNIDIELDKIKLIDEKPINIKLLKENLTLAQNRNLLNASLYKTADEATSILINSDEHCEIQTIARGLALENCFTRAYEIENILDKKIDFAYDKKFGYLTSTLDRIGVSMNLTVVMSIPAIMWKTPSNLENIIIKYSKLGFDLYVDTHKTIPNITITNRVMLGKTEKDVIDNILEIVHTILDIEKKIRNRIKDLYKSKIEDKIFRSNAILSSCRYLEYKELLKHISWLRVGVYYNILKDIDLDKLYYMRFVSQNNHIKSIYKNKQSNTNNINEIRAQLVREILSNNIEL